MHIGVSIQKVLLCFWNDLFRFSTQEILLAGENNLMALSGFIQGGIRSGQDDSPGTPETSYRVNGGFIGVLHSRSFFSEAQENLMRLTRFVGGNGV